MIQQLRGPARRGFTLIEMVSVLIVLAVLTAIALPRLTRTKDQAILASMKSDLHNLAAAEEDFFLGHQTYAGGVGPIATGKEASFVPSSGNVLTLSSVTATGWAAEVTNTALIGAVHRCGIYLGTAVAPDPAVTILATPTCY
jgi:prepilin-type N-terminal cleavage/methylation domain-containing protein